MNFSRSCVKLLGLKRGQATLMKTYKRCFREFGEEEVLDVSPTTELADIMLKDIGVDDINDLCPQCREELGIMNLLGFGQ